MTTEIDAERLSWPERLTLRDTKVYADEGQRIFTTATGHGYARQEYVRADLATTRTSEAEPVACADCGAKDPFMYPCHQQGCPHSPTPASDDQVEAVTDEMVGRAAVAVMKEDGCGYTINGLHVLCDDNLADGLVDGYGKALKQERCDCRVMARAALLAAMGSTKR